MAAIPKLNVRGEIPKRNKDRLKRDRADLISMSPGDLNKECEKYKKLKRTFKIITWVLVAVTVILLPVIVALIDKQKDEIIASTDANNTSDALREVNRKERAVVFGVGGTLIALIMTFIGLEGWADGITSDCAIIMNRRDELLDEPVDELRN